VRDEMRELSLLLDEWDPIGVYDPPEEGPRPVSTSDWSVQF
jgi:hypothetical protein